MDENQESRIKKIIKKLKQNFPPVLDEASSLHLLSTQEFINIITEHDPSINFDETEQSEFDLVKILQDEGYKYEAVDEDGGICMKWLVE